MRHCRRLINAGADRRHRALDARLVFLRGEPLEIGGRGQLDVDADAVSPRSRFIDQRLVRLGNRFEMQVTFEAVRFAQSARLPAGAEAEAAFASFVPDLRRLRQENPDG
ncbi:MAG TPA: hypothetical protein VHO24_00070 [Opitutaceae bacterium]|nr:hypothetical protein [Opitutaceae bacterium]